MSWFSKKQEIKEEVKEIGFTSGEKEKIAAMIEALPDGFLIFDKSNNVLMTNFQAQIFLNITAKEAIGKNILSLSKYPLCKPLVSLLGGGIASFTRQELMFRSDLIAEITSVPLVVGTVKIGTIVDIHDITQQKEIEKSKSEFITIAAHQLRTPTSIIKWTSQGLLEAGDLSPEQRDSISKLSQTNERIISLVNNLLNAIEAEGGKLTAKPALQSIEGIVISALKDFEGMANMKGTKIFLQKPKSGLPDLMVDPEKIKVAVSSLVDNALKYNPEGGRIVVQLSKTNGDVKVSIKDSGNGISEHDKQRLFTKFFRGQDAMKIDTEGRGLGLFIAKSIVESYGGSIGFHSRLGQGSEFFFTLPVKEKFGEYLTKEFY